MKISCPSCQAKYSIADEKVQDRLAKIRCRKCGTTIVIDGKVSPASVYAADAAGDASADTGVAAGSAGDAEQAAPAAGGGAAGQASGGVEYTIDYGDNDQRTMSLDQVVAAYNAGEITAETYVWAEGFPDWTPLSQVGEIVEALHAAAGSAPPAAEPAAETPWQEAAAPAPATGPDLFGSYDRAGSEDDADLATSAVAASPAPVPRGAPATGARNESSVLFSLSALTSAASSSKPAVSQPSSPGVTEDSGLIDLKALTAAASTVGDSPLGPPPGIGAAAPLGGAPLGMAPLGGVPMGGVTTAMDMSMPPQPKNKNGLFIAGGIVVAAVAVTLIIQLTGSKEEPIAPAAPAPVATVATADPSPPPTATTESEPEPTAEAQPPATGTAEEEEPPAPSKSTTTVKSTPKKSSTTKASSSTKSSSSSGESAAAAPKPKPATPTNKCGCKAGDLQCAMRCAAGG